MIEHVERPWGWYETLCEAAGSKVKRIHVRAGHELSLQKHHRRAEHWVVVLGVARVTIGQREFDLTVGGHCDIEQMQVHRLRNCTDGPVEIIEIQLGEYLSEDDIVRLEDSYGRT
jgi:mannose-1-phosphate guanylyltransferase/mannose-6-phosphate isomerase